MASLVVQSRFAGLKIEDDDYPSSSEGQQSKKGKTSTVKKAEPSKKLKNSNTKPQQSGGKKKKTKQPATTAQQWELWKQKDEEMVDGNFESELQQAILLSKLDFEEKKDVYKQFKKEADIEKKHGEPASRATTKKQKKKMVMSLEQFNDMVAGEEPKHNHEDEKHSTEEAKSPDKDTEFFERVVDETKNELEKDRNNDRVRNRLAASDEVITRVQFADAIERRDRVIAGLNEEIVALKHELFTTKSRNKKLCNILGQGEMKDKAEVIIESERLRNVNVELMAEVGVLHTELERERSRNADSRAKDKKKKSGNGDKEK